MKKAIITAILVPAFYALSYISSPHIEHGAINSKLNTTNSVVQSSSEDLENRTKNSNVFYSGSNIIGEIKKGYIPLADPLLEDQLGMESNFIQVSDKDPYLEDLQGSHDNFEYKEWCEATFKDGNHIYEAYKDIAFNIKYTPEKAKTDVWQTPFETTKSKNGDCEDAVFLFYSHLLPNQKNAEIVWGWVIDRRIGAARAHVWYQLKDKQGQLYVVEGFSKDWNGIIPMGIINQTESRKPICTLSHLEASRLAGMISRPDSWETYQLSADLHGATNYYAPMQKEINNPAGEYNRRHLNSGYIERQSMSRTYNTSWGFSVSDRMAAVISKEISKIFKKLHVLNTRYDRQKKTYASNLQETLINIENMRFGKDLNCRR